MMGENQQNILLSELSSASSYLKRIFNILSTLKDKKDFDFHLGNFRQDLFNFLEQNISLVKLEKSLNTPFIDILNGVSYFTLFLKLPFNQNNKKEWGIKFINLLYENAHLLHLYCQGHTPKEIELPRVNILSCEEKGGLPHFFLRPKVIENTGPCPILSLEETRKKKYAEFINLGHEAIYYKQILRAKEHFTKAINLIETSEALTLLAWVQSVLGFTEEAKKLCLKAIELDPGYGPPYNDLGMFFMEEGFFEESLKWFEKAKKSINYQNREYPYINSGRAYMKVKKYDQALKELQMALTLVPTHQALHKTVERLIRKLPELARENA